MRKHPLVSDWLLTVTRSVGRVYRSIGSDGPFKLVAPSEIKWSSPGKMKKAWFLPGRAYEEYISDFFY